MKIHTIPEWIPRLGGWSGLGYFGHIWLKKSCLDALDHELKHVEQQKRVGYLRWIWQYATSSYWRVEYEAEAYAVDVVAQRLYIDSAARMLSGWLYLKPCSFDFAKVAILSYTTQLVASKQ